MNRLLRCGLIPLLIGLAAAGPSPTPTTILMAVSKDGAVTIMRNGKVINCQQLREMFRASQKDPRQKQFSCKQFERVLAMGRSSLHH